MKHLKQLSLIFFLAFMTAQAAGIRHRDPVYIGGGYFDVYLKNNCSKEIEVTVRADGSSSTSKYKQGEKVKVPVKAGYEIYVDGKLFLKLTDAESGKEIDLCK